MSFWLGEDPFSQGGDLGGMPGGTATPAITGVSPTGQVAPLQTAPSGTLSGLDTGFSFLAPSALPPMVPGGQFSGSNMLGMSGGQPVFGNPLLASLNPLSTSPLGALSSLSSLSSLFGGGGGGLLSGLGMGFAGGQLGSLGANLLAPLFGLNSSEAGSIGGTAGEIGGGLIGALFGSPFLGAGIGDLFGTLLGDWIGGGIPQMAKPEAFVQALMASGNPQERALGEYIQQQGINRGFDLSEPGGTPFNPWLFGNIAELATRQQFPLHNGLLSFNLGFQNPVGLGFKTLAQLLAEHSGFPKVSPRQLLSIEPEMALIADQPTGSRKGAWSKAAQLLNELNAAENY
jgi:hypothetical protein